MWESPDPGHRNSNAGEGAHATKKRPTLGNTGQGWGTLKIWVYDYMS